MMRPTRSLLIVSCLSLASCGRESVAPGVAQSSPQAAAPAPAPTPAAAPATAPAPTGDAPATPPPLASHETNWPQIVAEVTEFRRKGNVLTAHLRLRNRGSENTIAQFRYEGVYVMDEAGAKKYPVLKDEKGAYIASNANGDLLTENIGPGRSLAIWMKFPAPPPEVRAVTLQIPNITPYEDLQILDR